MDISKAPWALVTVAITLSGCGGGVSGGAGPSLPPPTTRAVDPGSAVVLQVQDLGGMVLPWSVTARIPQASVYADGRVVHETNLVDTPVEQLPALPQVFQQSLTPAGLGALVKRARAAGVGDGADLGDPLIADVPTTRFALATDQGPVWSDAYALRASAGVEVPVGQPTPSPSLRVGSGHEDGTFTQEQADARYKLLDLSAALDDLPAALGADEVGEQVPYRPEALAVIIAPGSADPALEATPWPGPPLPGHDAKIGGTSCTVVRGKDLAPVLAAAGRALLKTPWTDGGQTWGLRFRPLLPDENSCQDLTPASPGP